MINSRETFLLLEGLRKLSESEQNNFKKSTGELKKIYWDSLQEIERLRAKLIEHRDLQETFDRLKITVQS